MAPGGLAAASSNQTRMPRYFFDTVNGDVNRDAEGVELLDDDAARTAGIRYLAGLLVDDPAMLVDAGSLFVLVRTEAGTTLSRVRATETWELMADAAP